MSSPAKPDLNDVLPRLNDMMREDDHWGDVAAYIPQLAKVDPAQFGIAVVTDDYAALSGCAAHLDHLPAG